MVKPAPGKGLTRQQAAMKRGFDVVVALIGLICVAWLIVIAWLLASWDTRSNGWFIQTRIGRFGKPFTVFKIKTMRDVAGGIPITVAGDSRITPIGRVLRKFKLDELPQLINVLIGDMSIVGPRPDLPGYADKLVGEEALILSIRPGITGPASIKYSNEEVLLATQKDPATYNRNVIWPDKVRINLAYIRDWRLASDIKYVWQTLTGA